jgi:hypothetical protein
MAVSTRLRGNEGVVFSLKIGAGSAVTFDDVKAVSWEKDDADDSDLTFYEAAQGLSKVYTLTVTGIVSHDSGSFYEWCWANPGATNVTLVYGPHGNATATATKPHYSFAVTNTGLPVFDHEANVDNTGAEFEYVFNVVGTPTKVTS